MIRNFIRATLAVTALSWGLAGNAGAAFSISISGGPTLTINDNDTNDENAAANIIEYSGTLSNITFDITASTTDPLDTLTAPTIYQTVSFTSIAQTVNNVVVAVSSSAFTLANPGNVQTMLNVSNLAEGTITGQSQLGVNTTTLISLTANGSDNNTNSLAANGTLQNILSFDMIKSPNSSTATSAGATLTSTFTAGSAPPPAVVPAPATLLALGTVLPFLGVAFRRRSAKTAA